MTFNDPFQTLFLLASANSLTLTTENEWQTFFKSLKKNGLISTRRDHDLVEKIWLEACASSRAFTDGYNNVSEPSLTFQTFKSRILKLHPVRDSKAALSSSSAIKLQALNLTGLLNQWDTKRLNEDQTRQLLSVVYHLEKEHLGMQDNCEELTRRVGERMENARLKALIHPSHDNSSNSSNSNVNKHRASEQPNPLTFHTQNLSAIEKSSLKSHIKSVRHTNSTSEYPGKTIKDIYGLTQSYNDVGGVKCYLSQGSLKGKLITLQTVSVPKSKVNCKILEGVWASYSAHKALKLTAACVMQTYGFHDDGRDISFYYEYIPSRSLSSLLYTKRLTSSSYVMSERSHLFKHLSRELLICLKQLSEQSPSVLVNAWDINSENIMILRSGTSARLGRLLWGGMFDPTSSKTPTKTFFRERECALIRGFGRVLRSMLSGDRDDVSIHSFVPSDSVEFDVAFALENEVDKDNTDANKPLVLTASVQIGQRLIITLPSITTLKAVQIDSANVLGVHPTWQTPILRRVNHSDGGDGDDHDHDDYDARNGDGRDRGRDDSIPMYILPNSTTNVNGTITLTILSTKTGTCDIQIPYYDSSLNRGNGKSNGSSSSSGSSNSNSMPDGMCSITVICEISEKPCSETLNGIMRCCINATSDNDSRNESRNRHGNGSSERREEEEEFITLRGLLDHEYFRQVDVKDLEDVMIEFENTFSSSSNANERDGGGGGEKEKVGKTFVL